MRGNRLISTFLLILGLYLIVSLSRNIFSLIKKGEEIKEESLKVEKLKAENAKLKEQLEYTTSSEFIEKEARDKLGLAKEGEQVVILPENVEKLVLSSEEEKEEELPNWKKWYRLFF